MTMYSILCSESQTLLLPHTNLLEPIVFVPGVYAALDFQGFRKDCRTQVQLVVVIWIATGQFHSLCYVPVKRKLDQSALLA